MPLPPFRYNAYQDPYVEDITSLMGQPSAIQARSVREIGDIRAGEALQKGAATAQMIGSLGEITQEGYAGYQEAKADDIYSELLMELADREEKMLATKQETEVTEPVYEHGRWSGTLTPRTTTSETGEISEQTLRETVIQTPSGPQTGVDRIDIGSATWEGPTGTGTEAEPVLSPDQFVGPRQALPPDQFVGPRQEGVLGDMPGMAKKMAIQLAPPSQGRRYKYVTDDGRHDISALRKALRERGVSRKHIRRLLSQATERNESITRFNVESERLGESAEDRRLDLEVMQLYENDTLEMEDFLKLGPKGPELYKTHLLLKNAQISLETAELEQVPVILRNVYAYINTLFGTDEMKNGALRTFVERFRGQLGDEWTDAVIKGGWKGIPALIERLDPGEAAGNLQAEYYDLWKEKQQYQEGSDEWNRIDQQQQGIVDEHFRFRAAGRAEQGQPAWVSRTVYDIKIGYQETIDKIDEAERQFKAGVGGVNLPNPDPNDPLSMGERFTLEGAVLARQRATQSRDSSLKILSDAAGGYGGEQPQRGPLEPRVEPGPLRRFEPIPGWDDLSVSDQAQEIRSRYPKIYDGIPDAELVGLWNEQVLKRTPQEDGLGDGFGDGLGDGGGEGLSQIDQEISALVQERGGEMLSVEETVKWIEARIDPSLPSFAWGNVLARAAMYATQPGPSAFGMYSKADPYQRAYNQLKRKLQQAGLVPLGMIGTAKEKIGEEIVEFGEERGKQSREKFLARERSR
jgi:hypothetical protein